MLPAAEITILHTNDIHGHIHPWTAWQGPAAGRTMGGFEQLESAVQAVRGERRHVLLLDAGDTISDTQEAVDSQGAAVTRLMNRAGYDAMAPGNHEFDFGVGGLRRHIQSSRFPVLAANVTDSASGKPLSAPYVIRTSGGIRVGILGLSYPNTPLTTAKKNVAGLEFRNPLETAREYIPKMKAEGAELIVVLSHLGLSYERHLAESVPGIHVVVGGHSHNRVDEPLRAGQTLIVQAGAHLSDLGRLDLTFENGRITRHRRNLIPLISSRKNEAESSPEVARLQGPVIRAQTLQGPEPSPRDEQSPADSLFADVIRERTEADIALLPGVGYAVAATGATLSARELKNFIPHDSQVILLSLTGQEVRQILEQSVLNVTTKDMSKKVGGIIQVSGLTFSWSKMEGGDGKVIEVLIAGQPLDPNRTYRVATNSMLAEGGHNYRTFPSGRNRQNAGSQFEMVKAGLTAKKSVATPKDQRILRKAGGQ